MSAARKAPPGFTWRPSLLPHLRRVLVLERDADGDLRGSVGPFGRKWIVRETGEIFVTRCEAQAEVEAGR
jgi:hypothetical protein